MADGERLGCLGAILRLFGMTADRGGATAEALPYRRKDFLLSRAEASFFGVLAAAVGQAYWLFPKIRIADLLWMPKGTQSRQAHMNRIQSKHIDFLLCDRPAVRPVLAIELDDSSHQRDTRRSRDEFVDAPLRAAGLPLLRVPARSGYNVNDLRAKIQAAVSAQR